jgi:hypothetical protein
LTTKEIGKGPIYVIGKYNKIEKKTKTQTRVEGEEMKWNESL